jgi:hypothetical protein
VERSLADRGRGNAKVFGVERMIWDDGRVKMDQCYYRGSKRGGGRISQISDGLLFHITLTASSIKLAIELALVLRQ